MVRRERGVPAAGARHGPAAAASSRTLVQREHGAPALCSLQRSVGNRAVAQVVQRLWTRDDLEQEAGFATDHAHLLGARGLFGWRGPVVRQMSRRYRALLDTLSHYHLACECTRVFPGTWPAVWNALARVDEAAYVYLHAHETEEGRRVPAVTELWRSIPPEREALSAIEEDSMLWDSYHAGSTWEQALQVELGLAPRTAKPARPPAKRARPRVLDRRSDLRRPSRGSSSQGESRRAPVRTDSGRGPIEFELQESGTTWQIRELT